MRFMAPGKGTWHFPVVVEQDEDGVYIVSCPQVKGCHSYGKTVDEALTNIREAIELCLQDEPQEAQPRFIGLREVELEVHG